MSVHIRRYLGQLNTTAGATASSALSSTPAKVLTSGSATQFTSAPWSRNITVSLTNSRFTVVTGGTYRVSATIACTTSAANDILFQFAKNGTVLTPGTRGRVPSGAASFSVSLEIFVDLKPGDYIELFASAPSGTPTLTLQEATFTIEGIS